MKKLLLIFTLLFSVMFSTTSFAEWSKIGNTNIYTIYVDFERIRKHDGYVYWWDLINMLKPYKDGNFSYKAYMQGDCKVFGTKTLREIYYKQPMGEGKGTEQILTEYQKNWIYPAPGTIGETELKTVCSH